ncbi:hypothetical protein KC350_g16 [Hortaea werneckii]|nr:hypothetical protein KC350_g16 [Hortaea werneckii]
MQDARGSATKSGSESSSPAILSSFLFLLTRLGPISSPADVAQLPSAASFKASISRVRRRRLAGSPHPPTAPAALPIIVAEPRIDPPLPMTWALHRSRFDLSVPLWPRGNAFYFEAMRNEGSVAFSQPKSVRNKGHVTIHGIICRRLPQNSAALGRTTQIKRRKHPDRPNG